MGPSRSVKRSRGGQGYPGWNSNDSSPTTTSSPGSKPARSSAGDHADLAQPALQVVERLGVGEVVAGDQQLDASPRMRQRPSPPARPRSPPPRPAGRRGARRRSLAGWRPIGAGASGSAATIARPSSSSPSRSPTRSRSRPRAPSPMPLPPLLDRCSDAPPRGAGRPCERAIISGRRSRPGAVAGELAADRLVVGLRVGPLGRRSPRPGGRAAGSARRGRGTRGRAPRPPAAPSISPGMSASTSWRSSSSIVPSTGSSVVNG